MPVSGGIAAGQAEQKGPATQPAIASHRAAAETFVKCLNDGNGTEALKMGVAGEVNEVEAKVMADFAARKLYTGEVADGCAIDRWSVFLVEWRTDGLVDYQPLFVSQFKEREAAIRSSSLRRVQDRKSDDISAHMSLEKWARSRSAELRKQHYDRPADGNQSEPAKVAQQWLDHVAAKQFDAAARLQSDNDVASAKAVAERFTRPSDKVNVVDSRVKGELAFCILADQTGGMKEPMYHPLPVGRTPGGWQVMIKEDPDMDDRPLPPEHPSYAKWWLSEWSRHRIAVLRQDR